MQVLHSELQRVLSVPRRDMLLVKPAAPKKEDEKKTAAAAADDKAKRELTCLSSCGLLWPGCWFARVP